MYVCLISNSQLQMYLHHGNLLNASHSMYSPIYIFEVTTPV